ncbi:MAG: EI24 domain-containing protein [Betaproteobacteria bacterium]|nr:EI24 domain-containing protein [Betaproteobacteria bacterium]
MSPVLQALARAFAALSEPRILGLLLLPPLGSLMLWTVLGWLFWDSWTGMVRGALGLTTVAGWLADWHALWVVDYTAVLAVLAAILPAMLATALLVTEIVAMPVIVAWVTQRHYPGLRRSGEDGLAASLVNALGAVAVFAVVWVLTLPLWLTGIGAFLAPLLNSAWLNQRMFRHDAVSGHATRAEMATLFARSRGELFVLGVLLSLLLYVPLFNLAVPVLSGLAFTHFCLARLERLRTGA